MLNRHVVVYYSDRDEADGSENEHSDDGTSSFVFSIHSLSNTFCGDLFCLFCPHTLLKAFCL